MSDYNDRLGKRTSAGREWPALDINGNPYIRDSISIIGVGGGLFTVAPQGFVANDTLDEIRLHVEAINDKSRSSKRSSKRSPQKPVHDGTENSSSDTEGGDTTL